MEPPTEAMDIRFKSHREPNASLATKLTPVPKADLPWDVSQLQRAVARMHAYETPDRPWHEELGITEGTAARAARTPMRFDPTRVRRYIEIARCLNLGDMVPRHDEVEAAWRTLCGFVASMAPYAEVRAMALVHGSPEWRCCREAIERAQRVSTAGAGDGLRAAADHALVLAGAVEDLLSHALLYSQEVNAGG